MKHGKRADSNATGLIVAAVALALSASLACHAPAVGGPTGGTAPDLGIGAAQFPDADAVILSWEQRWTLKKDGALHRRDHQWVKLLSRRPIGRVGDPRIDFVNGRDELIIHAAKTHMSDGTILPVPDYSFNIAGPDDVAGWPEYADWQQQIVSFSGIETGAVLELDYEVVTPPGIVPWIEADLRLNDEYPTVERVVSVTVPQGTTFSHKLDRANPGDGNPSEQSANGAVTYRWTFTNLSGDRHEPQSPSWRERSGRLRFTTCPSVATWVATMLDRVDRAGQPDESIKKFAESAVEDEGQAGQRVRKIAKKLHDSFNLITSSKSMQSLTCKDAPAVLRANYGNPLEAAALYLATLRSLGIDATPTVAVDATAWDEQVPVDSAFEGVVVTVALPDGPVYVHPEHGVFENPGHWGRHLLLSTDASGTLRKTFVRARGETTPSELRIAGKLTVDAKGHATGELRFHLTGLFYDPQKLDTGKAQKKLVGDLTNRLLTGFEVTGYSVGTLSSDVLRVTANVASKDELKHSGERFILRLGDGPAFLGDVPMPLGRSQRRTNVRLTGRVREDIDLKIVLPKAWKSWILPASLPEVRGTWGSASQTVDIEDKTIRFTREVTVNAETVSPADFSELRQVINDLRVDQSLVVMFGEAP